MAWVVPIVESVAAWLGPFWAKVALTVIEAAAAFGLSRLVAPRPGTLTAGSPLTLSRSPVDPRRVIYGRTRVSGTLVFATTWGDNDKYLDMAIAMAGHECDAIEAIYFNDDIVPTDGDGNATGTYAGYAYIKSHLGADDQLVDPTLAAHVPWDSDHRLRGIAYLAMHLTWDQGKFPAGMPNPTAVIRGRKVFDPRTQTTVWSDNPALAIRDYLTDTRIGMAVAADELDDNSFIAAANICDELITLPDTTTEKRYTCNGCFDLSADPCTILDQLCASMAGWVTYVGGRWICQAGAYIEPTITLDEDDLRASIEMQTKASMRDTCNGVKGTFASPSDHWQDEDFPEVQDGEAVDDDGVPIWKDLDLGFTTSAYTAQRLATIVLKRTRQDLVITMPCKLTALRARAGETVMVKNTRFGWVEKVFLVQELKFTPYDESGEPALGVDLTLCATAPERLRRGATEGLPDGPGAARHLRRGGFHTRLTGRPAHSRHVRGVDRFDALHPKRRSPIQPVGGYRVTGGPSSLHESLQPAGSLPELRMDGHHGVEDLEYAGRQLCRRPRFDLHRHFVWRMEQGSRHPRRDKYRDGYAGFWM